MTRKRTRESVEHVLCNECPTCHGRGTVKTVETVCYEIMREIVRVHHAYDLIASWFMLLLRWRKR